MRTRELDPVEAIRLLNDGKSYVQIGRILAEMRGRPSPFLGLSVYRAVRTYNRRAATEDEANTRPSIARSSAT